MLKYKAYHAHAQLLHKKTEVLNLMSILRKSMLTVEINTMLHSVSTFILSIQFLIVKHVRRYYSFGKNFQDFGWMQLSLLDQLVFWLGTLQGLLRQTKSLTLICIKLSAL